MLLKDTITKAVLIKENTLLGLAYSFNTFREFVQYLYGHMQANMVLQKELSIPHLDPQAAEATVTLGVSIGNLKAYP